VNSFNCIREDEELRIALISCTSIKKAYKCPARDLYSESPRFQLAFSFAKLIAIKSISVCKIPRLDELSVLG